MLALSLKIGLGHAIASTISIMSLKACFVLENQAKMRPAKYHVNILKM